MITLGICDALDYMHKHGVVHRDLKPENMMVDEWNRIKLIDFGIAMKEDARRITYASPSPMLGTPDYISPEQVKGQRGDQRSDIYALGAMLYEMLTGQPPFTGPNPLAVMNERLLARSQARARAESGDFARSCRRFSSARWSAIRATATPPPPRWPGNWSTRSRWAWRTERGPARLAPAALQAAARCCSMQAWC